MYSKIRLEVLTYRNPQSATIKYHFFTKNGEYATYDKFWALIWAIFRI